MSRSPLAVRHRQCARRAACPTDQCAGLVTHEREEAVLPLDWQAKAHNLVRILSVFLPQDADRDAVIYACCDGPISEELPRIYRSSPSWAYDIRQEPSSCRMILLSAYLSCSVVRMLRT